jgi:hypothetical protein
MVLATSTLWLWEGSGLSLWTKEPGANESCVHGHKLSTPLTPTLQCMFSYSFHIVSKNNNPGWITLVI